MKFVALAADASRARAAAVVECVAAVARGLHDTPGPPRCDAVGMLLRQVARADVALFDAHCLPSGDVPAAALLVWAGGDDEPPGVRDEIARHGWERVVAVDEHVQLPGTGDDAGRVTRFGLVLRNPELTREEFATRWVGIHGPLVIARQPLYDRYVSNVVRDPDAGWDGIVEQRFADMATWQENDRRIRQEKADVRSHLHALTAGLQQFAATDHVTVDS